MFLAKLLKPFVIGLVALIAVNSAAAESAAPQHCFNSATYSRFENGPILEKIARGINLPNWDASYLPDRPSDYALEKLAAAGMTHIRLPVFHEAFNTDDLNSDELAEYGVSVLSEIDRLVAFGYVVSVDFHPDGVFNDLYWTNPEAGYKRLKASWRYLASLLSETSPKEVLVELLNEPDADLDVWQDHAERLAVPLRQWLPKHTFVVGPGGPMRHESLDVFRPLSDDNVIYAVHYYDPFIFTHQGAEWLAFDDPVRLSTGIPFPTKNNDPRIDALVERLKSDGHLEAVEEVSGIFGEPWTTESVADAFDMMERWSKQHGLPIVVNEFGVLRYHANKDDRVFWLKTVVKEAEERCIGWTHWDFSDGFGIVDPDTGEADSQALNALIPQTN